MKQPAWTCKETAVTVLLLIIGLLAGYLATCLTGCYYGAPQVTYPISGATGVACASCYSGDRCDASLYSAAQVDAAVQLVGAALVSAGVVPGGQVGRVAQALHVCLVAGPLQRGVGSSWCKTRCTTPTVPGTCLAGCAGYGAVKVAVSDMQGRALKVWQSALAHELTHAYSVTFGYGLDDPFPEGDLRFVEVVAGVNAELQRRFP